MESSQINGLRVALEMERRGEDLYTRAQRFTRNPSLLALLAQLAQEEAEHYRFFTQMLTIFGIEAASPEENFLQASKAADAFFPGGVMQMAMDGAFASAHAMLDEAIKGEEESIAFYRSLLVELTSEKQKEIVSQIILEEKGHREKLMRQRECYEKDEKWT